MIVDGRTLLEETFGSRLGGKIFLPIVGSLVNTCPDLLRKHSPNTVSTRNAPHGSTGSFGGQGAAPASRSTLAVKGSLVSASRISLIRSLFTTLLRVVVCT